MSTEQNQNPIYSPTLHERAETPLQFYFYPEQVRRCDDITRINEFKICRTVEPANFFDKVINPLAFTVYRMVYNNQVIPFPQARKELPDQLSQLSSQGQEIHLECYLAAIDVDNPGHDLHSQQNLPKIAESFKTLPYIPQYWYITQHGFRLIYVLERPVILTDSKTQEFSGRMRSFQKELQEHFDKYVEGLDVDDGITQWHRVYKVPGLPVTEGQWWYHYGTNPEAPKLDLYQFPIIYKAVAEVEHSDAPDPSECFSLIRNYDEGDRIKNTTIGRLMASKLAGTEAHKAAFNPEFSIETERNNTLFRIIGLSVRKLFNVSGITKKHIFGIIGPTAYEMGEDDDGIPWTDKAWSMVCRLWAEKEAEAKDIDQQKQELSNTAESVIDTMIAGVSTWCPDMDTDNPEIAKDFIRSHLFCCIGQNFFPMGEDGFYEELPLKKSNLRAIFKNRRIGDVAVKITDKGKIEYPNAEEVLENNTTVCSQIHYVANAEGGTIKNIDQTAATLMLRAYRLDPKLEGEYSKEVDEWLYAMFGETNFELAMRWLAYSLDFSNPTSVLSIQSPPGTGKGLLVKGLSECLEVPNYCSGAELMSGFNDSLLHTPWVWVDEGWPNMNSQTKAASDVIRQWTGGGPQKVRGMYSAPVMVTNPCRFILTANNEGVVKELARNKILSPEDREALELRIVHFKLNDTGSKFLASRGGRDFTDGWVDRDGVAEGRSIQGNRTLAKHFKYLYENREEMFGPPGGRILVSGHEQEHNPVVNCLLAGGPTALVLETIDAALLAEYNIIGNDGKRDVPGLKIDVMNGKIEITQRKVLDVFRNQIKPLSSRDISIDDCGNVLNNFSIHQHSNGFYELDGNLVKDYLTKKGMGCKLIETVAEIQEQRRQVKESVRLGQGTR